MTSSARVRGGTGRRVARRPGLGHLDLDRDEERLYAMTPLDAELFGSVILAENYWARDPRDRGDPARAEILVAAHTGGDRPFNIAILLLVAAVGEPALSELALRAAEGLPPEIPRPPWADHVGKGKLLEAWRTRDDWLELVTLSLAHPGGEPAAVTAVVDRERFPLITHTMVEPELEPALARSRKNPHATVEPIPVSVAVEELRDALPSIRATFDGQVSRECASDRAFLAALLRRASGSFDVSGSF